MIVAALSIDIGGEWSVRQAEAVRRALASELEARGLDLSLLDVSTHARPNRVRLQVICGKHREAIELDAVCPYCLAGR